MNQEERHEAMLRMRGELPPESGPSQKSLKEKDDVKIQRNSRNGNTSGKKQVSRKAYVEKHTTRKNTTGNDTILKQRQTIQHQSGTGKQTSLRERKAAQVRKRKQYEMIVQFAVYLGALIIVIIIAVLALRGCGKKEANPKISVESMLDSSAENTDSRQTVKEQSTESQEMEETITSTEAEEKTTAGEAVVPDITDPNSEETQDTNALPVSANITVDPASVVIPSWIQQDFIRVNEYSRSGELLEGVEHIAIHYVSNPGTSAASNRGYFDNLGNPEDPAYGERKASAQFIVGLEGEIIQCMPLEEMAYGTKNGFNQTTVSIEACHPDETGQYNETTYWTVVKLAAWLMQQFHLEEDALLRHYDCDGKNCPKYYVEHEDAWEQLKKDIVAYRDAHPNIQ